MATTLTRMLTGEIPCEKIYEDAHLAAVLEPAPLSPGHTLVFPKSIVGATRRVAPTDWLSLDAQELSALTAFAQKLAKAIQKAFPCPRIAIVAYGLKTPHVHFHLIPVTGTAGEIDLTRTRPAASAEELHAAAQKIRTALGR